MASRTLGAKRTQYGAYVSLYIIIVLAVLVAVNWLANDNNKSFDTTTNKQYSLSEQTVKTVKNLKTPVYLTYFNDSTRFGTARDLLDRYANLSSKVHVAYVDPEKKPDIARAEGFRTQGGVVVRSGMKTEEAGALTEDGLTNAIIRSTKTGQKTICFVAGSGELALDDTEKSGGSYAKESLEKDNYKTSTFSLFEKQQVPQECAVVVIAGPKRDYLDPAVAAIKTYVENGGHVMFALSPAIHSARPGSAENAPTPNINKLLTDWGVTPDGDVVLDPQSRMFGFSEAVPLGAKYESQPIVRDLGRIATVFPLAQSLTVSKSAEKLISSSDASVAVAGDKAISPDALSTAKRGPFVIAAVGSLGSGAKQGRFEVVGSSGWLSSAVLGIQQVANRDLFLNSINWLSADEDLISIRPKNPEDRRIALTRSQSQLLFFSSVIFLPLLAIFSGIGAWWKRR